MRYCFFFFAEERPFCFWKPWFSVSLTRIRGVFFFFSVPGITGTFFCYRGVFQLPGMFFRCPGCFSVAGILCSYRCFVFLTSTIYTTVVMISSFFTCIFYSNRYQHVVHGLLSQFSDMLILQSRYHSSMYRASFIRVGVFWRYFYSGRFRFLYVYMKPLKPSCRYVFLP